MYAWPVVSTMVMFYLATIVTMSYVGELGPLDLAAAGLASMFCNVTGVSIAVGLSSGLETFASQLYGAGQYRQVGIVTQRTLVVISVALVPIGLLWFFTAPLLELVGIEADVAERASWFARVMILGLPAIAVQETVRKYLQCQGVMRPFVYVATLCNVVHLGACMILISPDGALSWGVSGAALTLVISYYLNDALVIGYCLWTRTHELTWGGWSRDCLQQIPAFLKLAVPGAGMICLEWWCFEIMTLLSASLGTSIVAAQTVMFSTTAIFFMVPLGFSIAVGARVGNFLGAGKPIAAQRVSVLGVISCCCITLSASFALFLHRRAWAQLFSQDPAVVEEIVQVMPIQNSFLILDAVQGVVSGVIRGCGNQHMGFYVNLLAYYGVALPAGLLFAFRFELGLAGLWYGLALGSFTQASGLTAFVCFVDYRALADAAALRCERVVGEDGGGKVGAAEDMGCGGGEQEEGRASLVGSHHLEHGDTTAAGDGSEVC